MSLDKKITIYWETTVEHKKVIFGTDEEIESVVESLAFGNSDLNDYLESLECPISTHQTSDSELDFYEVEDV